MDLGLLAESSLKDVSFVNLSDHFRRDADVDPTENRYPAARSSDLEESSDREDVMTKSTATSTTLWPFIYAASNMQTLIKSARSRRRSRKRWSMKRRWEPKSTTSEISCHRINDMASLKSKSEENLDVSSGSAFPRLSENNFSLMQLHARSPNLEDGRRDRSSEGYRPTDEKQIYQATWETRKSKEINQIDYPDRSKHSGSYLSNRETKDRSKIGSRRDRTDVLKRSRYFRSDLSKGNNAENTLENATMPTDTYENDTQSAKAASFSKNISSEINESTSSKDRNASCKSIHSNNRNRRVQLQKRNCQLENKGYSVILKKKGKTGRKKRHYKSAANNNYNVSRNFCKTQENTLKCEPVLESNFTDDTHDTAENAVQKHCDCSTQKRSYEHFTNTACACKVKLKSTATAIMRDIQVHIQDAEIAKDVENIRNTIPEVFTADDPSEKQDQDINQDISMGYDWEYDNDINNEDDSTQSSKQSLMKFEANVDEKALLTNIDVNRKPRKNISTIDYKFVDRMETTYQRIFHECVDLDSSVSVSSLKINMDENWGSEDSDVGTLHSSWPRSSLTEECGNEFDSMLPLGRKIVNDDSFANCEEYYGDEEALTSTCYKNSETPDILSATHFVRDSETESIITGMKQPDDTEFTNAYDEMKNIITYRNKNKSIGKSSLTDCNLAQGKKDNVKIRTRITKSAADGNKVSLIQRDADDKNNDTGYDSDKRTEYALRRITRASIKKENHVGKLVWGYCSGWWPALIVDATHVGMVSESGKLWVYWIGESQISLLKEKTQVQPFSMNLQQRLTHNFHKNNRSQAIHETIQMLRQRYEFTLTKPYYFWIERNITKLEELDNLTFYPYPSKIQERLEALKKRNAKITEQFILKQRNSPEPPKKQIIEKPKDVKLLNQIEDERLPLQEQNPGVIAWAKISGHNWWPAMIVDYRDCCLKEPGFGCQWIMWYGDYTVSQVHHLAFLKFHKGIEKMRDYIQNTKKHLYLVGVLQASKDYCSRLGCNTDNWTLTNVFKYFSDMNNIHVPYNHLQVSDSNKIYDKYSDEIVKKINELKADPSVDDKRKDDIKASDALRRVMLGEFTVEKLCLKCLKFPNDILEEHPFFIGSLCKTCSNLFKPCMFVFGNDGKCFYCTICAASGTVVICDKESCPRVYCTACLKFLICPEAYDDMLLEDPWECFLCRDKSRLPTKGLLHPRSNWKEKMIGMFRTTPNTVSNELVVNNDKKKRSIRVLSLFDGLSTGLLVLLKLGIVVDIYYASEIDKNALMVSNTHFGNRITHLGDVRGITKEKIKEIAPIDLLIGGSPCNDLSMVNPARLGLHDPKGTGILFFEYCRIMKLLKRVNKNRHLFWLFENVASMPSEYRLEMNKHLGQEPVVIDSADFSPQHRLRLYWHNFPFDPYMPSFEKQQDVQDILTPHCNRYALVKKIRTVTTRTHSLRQGKLEQKPIMMEGECDSLWITELEEIFGFPRHYTDVRNLSATNRQKLIGKSWSVQTLSAILRPLCSFFKCNENETS